MDSPDLVQYQRIASGYIPGASELFPNTNAAPSQPPLSGKFQNCSVVRPAGAGNAAGVYDILLSVPQASALNKTALRSKNGPEVVGLGGPFVGSPPIINAFAPGEVLVQQGRFSSCVRSGLQQPPSGVTFKPVTVTVAYGATFLAGAAQLYPGFDNAQIIRVFVSSVTTSDAIALVDADLDFGVERVIDPSLEP